MTGPEEPTEPPADSKPAALPGPFEIAPVDRAEKSRRRRTMAIFLGVVALLILFGFLHGAVGGGGISATRIGPLLIGQANVTDVHATFGLERAFWTKNKAGAPIAFKGELWRYNCPGAHGSVFGTPCRTLFGFRNGRLQSVLTNDPQYSTHAGTRIGSTVSQAVKRDHGRWSGFGVSCPAVTFPSPQGTVFEALVFRNALNPGGVVSGYYLSKVPGSFSSPCGS